MNSIQKKTQINMLNRIKRIRITIYLLNEKKTCQLE